MLYQSQGKLSYHRGEQGGYKLIVEIDSEINRYYRSLIPRWLKVQSPKYPAHVSVVRKEVPANTGFWGKYEGETVDFLYQNVVYFSENYVWLDVYAVQLEEIRIELGLPIDDNFGETPLDGFRKIFHTTLGNFKW